MHNTTDGRRIRPDSEVLIWEGAIEVEHTSEWSRAWRLPYSTIGLFPTEPLRSRATMGAGVRIALGTDSKTIVGRAAQPGGEDLSPIDLVVDGHPIASTRMNGATSFRFAGLPDGDKTVEIWLPQFGQLRLTELAVDPAARIWRPDRPQRPTLLVYGSSITQCRTAASPTRTWPALVAAQFGANLTCLGFGGECHLDPMVARLIRDQPADAIVACLGINVYGKGSFNSRSFLPAVLGFVSTVRDGHPGIPIVVISPIISPPRENTIGAADLTLVQIRTDVHNAIQILRDHGDGALHAVDGRSLLGPEHLQPDGVHPDAQGYEAMARSLTTALRGPDILGPPTGPRAQAADQVLR